MKYICLGMVNSLPAVPSTQNLGSRTGPRREETHQAGVVGGCCEQMRILAFATLTVAAPFGGACSASPRRGRRLGSTDARTSPEVYATCTEPHLEAYIAPITAMHDCKGQAGPATRRAVHLNSLLSVTDMQNSAWQLLETLRRRTFGTYRQLSTLSGDQDRKRRAMEHQATSGRVFVCAAH